ncbi:MAG TPA: glycine cleavage system protein H [Terriglobales bacterium]|nr:glycine cleavage system protein H [Terriglobales bacterium]
MSILFVLLTFLVVITVSYFVRHGQLPAQVAEVPSDALPVSPVMMKEGAFEMPKGFCFHPGHTWVYDEGRQNARIGLDSFAGKVFGKIDRIEVANLNRWVRQGQKVCTISSGGSTAEILSPVEGVVVSVNHEVLKDPGLIQKDPYKEGWVCVIKAPDLEINTKNLLQGGMIGMWMQNSLKRLQAYAAPLGAAAADGGLPVDGLLAHLDPNARREMIREFFLN